MGAAGGVEDEFGGFAAQYDCAVFGGAVDGAAAVGWCDEHDAGGGFAEHELSGLF